MSTRSNIAIEDPKTKKVKVIYVHSDGYPYGVGKCLVDNYNRRCPLPAGAWTRSCILWQGGHKPSQAS